MPTYDCLYCGLAYATREQLARHALTAIHPQQAPTRPLLMMPKSMTTHIWACDRCNDFSTENKREADMHEEACANPPNMREVETAAAKLVKLEAELAAAIPDADQVDAIDG